MGDQGRTGEKAHLAVWGGQGVGGIAAGSLGLILGGWWGNREMLDPLKDTRHRNLRGWVG